MKVSEMIKNLQEFVEEHGDLECWYAVDDEGNDYNEIYYTPTKFYVNNCEDVFQQEDYDEANEEDKKDLTPICVVN